MFINEEVHKTFIIKDFGLIINDKIIPIGSIGKVSEINNSKIYLNWVFPNKEKKPTIISFEEFKKLVENGYMKDMSLVQKPKTEPLYKKGDLVKFCFSRTKECICCKTCTCYEIGDEGIIDSSAYNFEREEWEYRIFNIGDDFKKTFEPNCYEGVFEEKYLKKIDKILSIVNFNNKKYLLSIEEKA